MSWCVQPNLLARHMTCDLTHGYGILDIKITPHEGTHTQTNMRGPTLVWWLTLAFLLRRSSTIWSWPFSHAIYNAVWPSCICKREQDRPEVIGNVQLQIW